MATRAEFIQRQHDEVKETLEKLGRHQSAIIEKLKLDENSEELKALLGEAEIGVQALTPILADFNDEGVDPDELIGYAKTIEEWQEKEKALAVKLS